MCWGTDQATKLTDIPPLNDRSSHSSLNLECLLESLLFLMVGHVHEAEGRGQVTCVQTLMFAQCLLFQGCWASLLSYCVTEARGSVASIGS